MRKTGRELATKDVGVDLAFSGVDKDSLADLEGSCGPKSSVHSSLALRYPATTRLTVCPPLPPGDRTPKAPLFNIVDDGGTTQDTIAKAVAQYFGIKHDYYGAVTALFAKLSMKSESFEDMVDDANEVRPPASRSPGKAKLTPPPPPPPPFLQMHVEAWAEMAAKNSPPIENSPLTPYLDAHEFQKVRAPAAGRRRPSPATDAPESARAYPQLAINLDGSLARKVLDFQPVHKGITKDEVGAIVKGFRAFLRPSLLRVARNTPLPS